MLNWGPYVNAAWGFTDYNCEYYLDNYKHVTYLAGGGADAASELWEVVGLKQSVECFFPIVLKENMNRVYEHLFINSKDIIPTVCILSLTVTL